MYVVSRVLSFEKGIDDNVLDQMKKPSIMKHFKGFIRRDVLLNVKNPDKDIVRILVYWESKEDYYRFEGSKEHIMLHKDRSNPHHQKPVGLIDMSKEVFTLLQSEMYEPK